MRLKALPFKYLCHWNPERLPCRSADGFLNIFACPVACQANKQSNVSRSGPVIEA